MKGGLGWIRGLRGLRGQEQDMSSLALERDHFSTRGGHSNRLCTNTRDRGQELGQAVKAENLEGQAVKGTSQIRKSQGSSTVKVNRIQNLIKARYHTLNSVKSKAYLSDGQAVKALIKVKFFDRAVAGVGTESIGVTSPCF